MSIPIEMDHEKKEQAREENEELIPEILTWDIGKMLRSVKIEKEPGPDKLSNKIIKSSADVLEKPLAKIFNKIIESENVREQWEAAEIIILHKKGDKNQLNNYRPIRLSLNLDKIFMKVLKERIYNQLDSNQAEE